MGCSSCDSARNQSSRSCPNIRPLFSKISKARRVIELYRASTCLNNSLGGVKVNDEGVVSFLVCIAVACSAMLKHLLGPVLLISPDPQLVCRPSVTPVSDRRHKPRREAPAHGRSPRVLVGFPLAGNVSCGD